jgi:hypothetical protein
MYSKSLLLPFPSLISRFMTGEQVIGYALLKVAI